MQFIAQSKILSREVSNVVEYDGEGKVEGVQRG
jgi:hypothetical protein